MEAIVVNRRITRSYRGAALEAPLATAGEVGGPRVKGGGHPFAALSVGSRGVGKRYTLSAITERSLPNCGSVLKNRTESMHIAAHGWRRPADEFVLAKARVYASPRETPGHT